MRLTAKLIRAACGSVVAAALSLGAAQAVASPAPAARSDPRACDPQSCDRACRAIGALGGFCNGSGVCLCYIDPR